MLSTPHPTRSRRRYVIVGGVILLVLTALIVVRCAVSSGSAPGPRSYSMTSVWDNKNVGLQAGYRADSGTILLWQRIDETNPVSPHQISAVDLSTGKQKWAGGPGGWDVNIDYIRGNKLTAQSIIVQSNSQKNAPGIAALSLTDGKVLWKVNTPAGSSHPTAVTSNVVVVSWDSKTLRGINSGDGAKLWETTVADGCEADELSGDGDLVVVDVVCAKKRYLESFDPASGKSLWQHAVPIEGTVKKGNLSVRGNAAMLSGSSGLLVLGKSGETVFETEFGRPGDVEFTATSDLALVAYPDKSGVDSLTAVELSPAKVRWTKPAPTGSLSIAGDKLYSLARLPDPLIPAGLYEIALSTGQMAVSPTHLTYTSFDSLVATDGNTLVSYYHAHGTPYNISHLQSHRLEPLSGTVGFAGGAPAATWPDSCALLRPDEVGAAYQAQPQKVTVVDAELPAGSCRFQPASVTSPVVLAGVAWVGTDIEQAKQVMSRIQQYNEVIPLTGIGDEAVQVEVFGDPKYRTDVYFRAGARIGKVSIVGDSALALKLAKIAVTRLG